MGLTSWALLKAETLAWHSCSYVMAGRLSGLALGRVRSEGPPAGVNSQTKSLCTASALSCWDGYYYFWGGNSRLENFSFVTESIEVVVFFFCLFLYTWTSTRNAPTKLKQVCSKDLGGALLSRSTCQVDSAISCCSMAIPSLIMSIVKLNLAPSSSNSQVHRS